MEVINTDISNLSVFDIEEVDFNDPCDIGGFVALVCQIGADLGMALSVHEQTDKYKEIRRLAVWLVRKIEAKLPEMTPANALDVIPSYSLIYRFAHSIPAPDKLVDKYLLNAFDLMLQGNKTIDEYVIYEMLVYRFALKDRAFYGKPLQWSSNVLYRWYEQYKYGKSIGEIGIYDSIQRINCLLRSNLRAYEPTKWKLFKQKLVDNHSHLFYHNDILDQRILTAIEHLLFASADYLSENDYVRYSHAILSAKLSSPSTNRYLRKALEISTLSCS